MTNMGMCSCWFSVLSLLLLQRASAGCIPRELDFVILEGDSMHAAVEDDIRAELATLGITVNARFLNKTLFNAAMTSGDFHMCFSETWGAPYDPVAYATAWMANNEAHYSAMSGVTGSNSRANLFTKINSVLSEDSDAQRATLWGEIHSMVHQQAVNLPLWGKRIPHVVNNRLSGYYAGYQQYDYPVHRIVVQSGSKTVTIAPGAQTGLFQSVGRLDPHSYRPNEFFANNWVYEGLLSYGSDGAIVPALAESWTENANGYTFKLRTGVKFHDGEDWDCSVAKLNFDHVLASPLTTADWHGWYGLPGAISGWTCNSGGDLVVTTSGAAAALLQELTFIRPLRMLSPASFKTTASDGWQTNNSCPTGWGDVTLDGVTIHCDGIGPVSGTGPFKWISRTTTSGGNDAEVVFHRHTTYWGGVPDVEVLIIKRYETAADVAAALLGGTLDMVAGDGVLAPADLNAFMTTHSSSFYTYMSPVMMHTLVIINSGKAPTDDLALRKAIIHGVDKAKIIQQELGGIGEAVDRVFPKSAPYSRVELTPRWDYDSEKATMLNCPAPAATESDDGDEVALGLGLGFGLGIPLLSAMFAAVWFYNKSVKSDTELKVALKSLNSGNNPQVIGQA